ncbi:hypothetical protein BDW59DRAFT_160888 [Aspergillus cavernicola]|uniref:VCBS repeat-containing protein n=1 Tax=Aspergillus cavernicola TaxID=176166 RepID=A0ABR4IGJ0_9EURO
MPAAVESSCRLRKNQANPPLLSATAISMFRLTKPFRKFTRLALVLATISFMPLVDGSRRLKSVQCQSFGRKVSGTPTLTLAYPRPPLLYNNATDDWTDLTLRKRDNLEGHSLRILPLGASITRGNGSSDKNGCRKHLREALQWANAEVNMVDSMRSRTDFNNNNHEGHNGFTIKKLFEKAELLYHQGSGADNGPYKHKGMAQGLQAVFASVDKEYIADTIFWADLTGNGQDNQISLCIDPDGRTFAAMSTGSDVYTNMRQVKKPEGKDRANFQFVDVNGDGKADMIWLDKLGGSAQVWYNKALEHAPDTQSSMTWRHGGDAYLQSARGEAIHFDNLRGTGRADMIDAVPRTNEATTWFSVSCGGGGGGDDGPLRDPGLPQEDGPPSGEDPPPGEDNPPVVG